MDCVLVRPRFGRCRLASLLALAALAVAGGAAAAQAPRTVLVFPARGHWTLEPLREAVSQALPEALRQAGFEVVTVRVDSPLVDRARHEGLVVGETATPERLETQRYALAVLAGLDAVLTAEVTGGDGGAVVQAELAGAVSQRSVKLEARAATSDPSAAAELAKQLAAAITPEVWQQAAADAEGRKGAAAAQYAAGQAALAAGRAAEAVTSFEAAVAVEAENADYQRAAGEANMAVSSFPRALDHFQSLVRLRPDDAEARSLLGEAALRAGRPEVAEPAFRAADRMQPDNARAVEGLARAYRAEGDFAHAREQYQRLLALAPALRGEPAALAGSLAGLRDDSVRFAGLSDDEATRVLALFYFERQDGDRGIEALYRYHQGAERPAYGEEDYRAMASRLDEQAERLARRAESLLQGARPSDPNDQGTEKGLEETHSQSDRLADLAEMMRVPPEDDAAHRYRVLAYNLLNESNFEALLYARTNDASHERRSSLLREACRKALRDAAELGQKGAAEESTSRGVEAPGTAGDQPR